MWLGIMKQIWQHASRSLKLGGMLGADQSDGGVPPRQPARGGQAACRLHGQLLQHGGLLIASCLASVSLACQSTDMGCWVVRASCPVNGCCSKPGHVQVSIPSPAARGSVEPLISFCSRVLSEPLLLHHPSAYPQSPRPHSNLHFQTCIDSCMSPGTRSLAGLPVRPIQTCRLHNLQPLSPRTLGWTFLCSVVCVQPNLASKSAVMCAGLLPEP